ncbi:hypothetical protein [Roseovarius sp. MBR-78]|uniref:hypothetical protein n=1 Tax=Roseovarius sp. MBR-78 TaxID=3156460 RepID=UPI00339701EF
MATTLRPPEFDHLRFEADFLLPGLTGFSLTHETLGNAFGDTDELTAVSLASNRIALSARNSLTAEQFSVVVTGAGISPVSTLDALEQAIMDGLATGALDRIVVADSSGFEFLTLDISATGYTLTSGEQVLTVDGTLPDSLGRIGALAADLSSLDAALTEQAEQDALSALLSEFSAFSIDAVALKNAGVDIASIAVSDTEVRIEADGYAVIVIGNFADFLAGGTPTPELIVDSVVIANPNGDEIASIRDIADLNDLEIALDQLFPEEGKSACKSDPPGWVMIIQK